MAVCAYCKKRFNVKKAAQQYNYETGLDYYEVVWNKDLCDKCAIREAEEGMAAWRSMSEYYHGDD